MPTPFKPKVKEHHLARLMFKLDCLVDLLAILEAKFHVGMRFKLISDIHGDGNLNLNIRNQLANFL